MTETEIDNQVTVIGQREVATADQMKSHVQRIQQVMAAVMKDGTHYGKIPGTGDKPTLLKPGAEVICLSFHIAPSYRIVDLSVTDKAGDPTVVRYRVTCAGTHQGSSVTLGEGVGECSSNELKYKWRRAANSKEFEATDLYLRRIKYSTYNGKDQEVMQVRVEPADVANTILKMACKRALVAMVLNVAAASDIFAQDLEELPEGLDSDDRPQRTTKPATGAPQAKSGGTGSATEKQVGMLRAKLINGHVEESLLLAHFELESLESLPFLKVNDALKFIADQSYGD